jgi:hypothetical protein
LVVVALTRAHEAREHADGACDGYDRDFWLEMERRWVRFAQRHEAQGPLGTFFSGMSLKAS